MKHFSHTLLAVSLIMVWAAAFPARAQQQDPRQFSKNELRPPLSIEQKAERRAAMMKRELALDEKQYKKLVKLYTKQFEYLQEVFPEGSRGDMRGNGRNRPQHEGSRPDGPRRDGVRPDDSRPDGHNRPEAMRPDGSGPRMNGDGHRGQGYGRAIDSLDEEARNEFKLFMKRQDKKLRKILTPAQYEAWKAKDRHSGRSR